MTKEEFTKFDPSEYLDNQEAIETLLHDAWLSDDSRYFNAALGHVIKAVGVASVAEKSGLTRQGIYKAIDLDSKPQFETVSKILKALGVDISFNMKRAS